MVLGMIMSVILVIYVFIKEQNVNIGEMLIQVKNRYKYFYIM